MQGDPMKILMRAWLVLIAVACGYKAWPMVHALWDCEPE